MTPKEKAQELIYKFTPHSSGDSNINESKECALILVDECIKTLKSLEIADSMKIKFAIKHWEWVKQEIEKL